MLRLVSALRVGFQCRVYSFTTRLTPGTGAPQVSVVSVQPFTLNQPNQIEIAWSGNDYTDGQVLWGPRSSPRANNHPFGVDDSGNEPNYSGQYTATVPPALQGQILLFTIRVRNSNQDATLWFPTTIGVLSARNYRSAQQFLQASNVAFPTGVRPLLKGAHSLRALMQI